MDLDLILAFVGLGMQTLLLLYAYHTIRGGQVKGQFILAFVVLDLLRTFLLPLLFQQLTARDTFLLVVVELYYLGSCLWRGENKQKSYFYAIYTFFFIFTLYSIISLILYEFLPLKIQELSPLGLVFIFFVLSFLSYNYLFRQSKIDVSILSRDDDFVDKRIIKPVNKILTVSLLIFVAVHYLGIWSDREELVNYSKFIMFAYLFLLFGIQVFLSNKIANFKQEEFQKEREIQYKRLKLYIEEIEFLYQKIRGFKHDYKNLIISLEESIRSGNLNTIRTTYNDVLLAADLELRDGEELEDLTKIKYSPLKSLLYWKLSEAQKAGVTCHLEVKDELTDTEMGGLDFTRVMAILLDNAVEAAKDSQSPKVELAMVKQNSQYIIYLRNSMRETDLTIEEMYKQGQSSKGDDRGTGLANVSQLIDSSPNMSLETAIDKTSFTQVIYIGE